MKITIEPSYSGDDATGYYSVSIDTRTNDETTGQAVTALLDALRAYGHSAINIVAAAEQWAAENGQPDVQQGG